jgi:hypothetical protein
VVVAAAGTSTPSSGGSTVEREVGEEIEEELDLDLGDDVDDGGLDDHLVHSGAFFDSLP